MAVMTESALGVDRLSFRYHGQSSPCLDIQSLEVNAGERFGLLGPNGAGKSTFMHLLCGILQPVSGKIELFGQSLQKGKNEYRKLFGFVPQDFSFYPELSAVENLEFYGAWYGMDRSSIRSGIESVLEVMGLTRTGNKPVRTFSGGMKRRVNLAIGVLHKPKILFLDEPTVGVDVQSGKAIIDFIKELNRGGTTLFYSSHQMKEAQDLCERIALIDEGKILACGSMEKLIRDFNGENLEDVFLKLTGKEFRD
jgi:ABC-2 type transport system ATP-binding protein